MLSTKVALGAALLGGAQLLSRVADLLAVIIVARVLQPAEFGTVSLALSILVLTNAVTELPVTDILVQRSEISKSHLDAAFTLNFARALVVALVLALAALLTHIILPSSPLALLVLVLIAAPVAQGLFSPAVVHATRKLDFRISTAAQVIGKIAGFLTSLVLVLIDLPIWALPAGAVVTPTVATVVSYRFARYTPVLSSERIRELISFAGWITLSKIFITLNQQSDRLMIGGVLGTAALGRYAMGSDLASHITYSFANPIMQPMLSAFSRLSGDVPRLKNAYLRSQQMAVLVILPLGVGAAAVADLMIQVLLGPGWEGVATVFSWLAPVIALQMLVASIPAVAISLARTPLLAVREGLALAIRLPPTVLGAFWFGLVGAAVARSVTGIAIIVMNLSIARRLLGLTVWMQVRNNTRAFAGAIVMFTLVRVLVNAFPEGTADGVLLALAATAGAAIYASTVLGLWLVTGKPESAESTIIGIVSGVGARFRNVRTRN